MNNELYHYGIPGMKWGVRKDKPSYRSTGVRSALARRSNEKVDKGFKNWNENAKKREDAIALGKKANASKMAYESNRSDKALRSQYKADNKAYKNALKSNTTYRKGQVRKEVGSDLSRKYLSDAKKIQKKLVNDPGNKQLQKQYNRLMSQHDIERAKARRAPEVAAKRSARKANLKRAATMSVKAVAATATVAAGTYAVNRYLRSHNVTLDGTPIRLKTQNLRDVAEMAKKAKRFMGYFY